MSDDGVFHDEIEIEDFEYDENTELFTYPCPCGDLFTISKVCFKYPFIHYLILILKVIFLKNRKILKMVKM